MVIPIFLLLKLKPLSYTIEEILTTEYYSSFLDNEIEQDFQVKREVMELTFRAYQEDGESRICSYAVLPLATCARITIKSSKEEVEDWLKNKPADNFEGFLQHSIKEQLKENLF